MKRITIATKINSLIIGTIILIALAVSFGVNIIIEKSLLSNYEESLQSASYSNYHYLDARYTGDWSIESGVLYKGTYQVEDMNAELDSILDNTNVVATIFMEDTRIATNVKVANERATGTKASEEVAKQVLNGTTYIGVAYGEAFVYNCEVTVTKDHEWEVAYKIFDKDTDVLLQSYK